MIFIGVDIAKSEHCLGAIDAQGKVVRRPVRFRQDAAGFAQLAAILAELGGPGAVTIGCEATGHYWMLFAEELVRLGYQPQVFNPLLASDAARRSVRGRKTDEDDCLVIAKVLRDGDYTPMRLSDAPAGTLKRLTRYRQGVVEQCANLKKRLITLLDQVFPEFPALFSDAYGASARAVLAKAPSARLIAGHTARAFTAVVRKASHGRLGLERIQAIIAAAKTSIAAHRVDTATEMAIRNTIAEIALLEQQIDDYDRAIAEIPVPGRELLTTIPGVGPIIAAVILAEIGDITAFRRRPGDRNQANPHYHKADPYHRLLAFAGLDPRVCRSGQWQGTVRMSKRGSRSLRTAIWRAAFIAAKHPAFSELYRRHRVTMQQHHHVALSHVARKIVQAIYGVLRYQTPFDPVALAKGRQQVAA